jgi:lipopolysaccharide/colanic/teichoic acid biosynthesis glycosyltransferase
LSAEVEAPAGPRATDPAGTVRIAGGSARPTLRTLDSAFKRGFDVVASGLLLVALAPVLVVVAIMVRLDSPGPSFFRCDRVGYRGRSLRMLKFRKMRCDVGTRPLTLSDDERFTRLGRGLTKYKLDELPQLWHVLRGEMSLVGPRPEGPEFVQRYAEEFYDHILTVRPGIVGLSQLAFAEENRILDPEDPVGHYVDRILPQKVRLDRMYATRRSLLLDARIIFWAVVAVLLRLPVAVDRRSPAMFLRLR